MNEVSHYPCRLPSPAHAWLAYLGAVLNQVRVEGLMAIEGDMELPAMSPLLQRFPQTLKEPYLGFATDILRVMIGGTLEVPDVEIYARHAIAGFTRRRFPFFGLDVDRQLLELIWLTLRTSMQGKAPVVAMEFGRQAIAGPQKPSAAEIEQLWKDHRDAWRHSEKAKLAIDERIEAFIDSLH